MKSIFNSELKVTVSGTKYKVEADETYGETQFFKITNLETNYSEMCLRRGEVAKVNTIKELPEEMVKVLESLDEVDVIQRG
jgi:hypothetical protein